MQRLLRILSIVFLLSGLCCLPFLPSGAESQTELLSETRLFCLNIGKADCMLLFHGEKTYLIDAGYEQTYPALETALREFGVDHLDGVFLTHVHKDHEGGLEQLAKSNISIDTWYAPAIYYDVKPTKHPLYRAAAARGQQVTWLSAGDTIPVSDDAAFEVLGPIRTDTENENNNSLVLHFSAPSGSILLAADMKEEEERDLLNANAISPVSLLKVGHHGDNKATSQPFLQAVQPKAAVISTSTIEEPDTPAASTLSRLKSIGSAVYITQDSKDGFLFTLSGNTMTVQDYIYTSIPPRLEGLSASIHRTNDTLAITNTSPQKLLLTDAYLYSSKGNDVFDLPEIALEPGESYLIGSEKSLVACDFIAQKKRIWHDEKRDVALIYDAYGRILCGTDNGLAE